MLDYVSGILVSAEPNLAVVDIGGWGCKLNISLHTYNRIKSEFRKEIKLYTQLILKEDVVELMGFYDPIERHAFELLNKVPGIGAKVAISILSILDVAALKSAVMSEDIKTLSSIPGVGKKTAQKIVIDLKDRIKDLPVDVPSDTNLKALYEAKQALESLGFNPNEIQIAIEGALDIHKSESVEEIIKKLLKKLSK